MRYRIRPFTPLDRPDRRGVALYSLVISVSLLVSLMGLAGLTLVRVNHQAAERAADLVAARRLAQTAVEAGWLWIADNPQWRDQLPNRVWIANQILGRGTYSLEVTDPIDGNLVDDLTEPVLLVGTGVQGRARQKVQATLELAHIPLTCLKAAVATGDTLEFDSGTIIADAPITANDNIDASGAAVYAPVESAKRIRGWSYLGTTTERTNTRTFPSQSNVFDDYVAAGTVISRSSLPTVSGEPTMENVVLSPTSNPFGTGQTNPQGIYVIDCDHSDINVQNCRVIGTLVLLDAQGGNIRISGSVHFEPAVVGFPSLMVQGDVRLDLSAGPLESYASRLGGLVYVSRNATCEGNTSIDGVLVVEDDLKIDGNLTVTYRPDARDNPPPGFSSRRLHIKPGSWQRDVD